MGAGSALLALVMAAAAAFGTTGCLSPKEEGLHCAITTHSCPGGRMCDLATDRCLAAGDSGVGAEVPGVEGATTAADGGASADGSLPESPSPGGCAGCSSCPCDKGALCLGPDDCKSGYCVLNRCQLAASCREIHDHNPKSESGFYGLQTHGELWGTFCEMTLDGGGWSLVLKQTGRVPDLGYESPNWVAPNLDDGRWPDGADLATYSDVQLSVGYEFLPFTQIRMGFGPSRLNDPHPEYGLNYLVADVAATSLQAVIASGEPLAWEQPPPLDRWLMFDVGFELAPYCIRQGFNVDATVRVGVVASADPDCTKHVPTSYIGFGARGEVSAGNACTSGCVHLDHKVPAFSVLMVR